MKEKCRNLELDQGLNYSFMNLDSGLLPYQLKYFIVT